MNLGALLQQFVSLVSSAFSNAAAEIRDMLGIGEHDSASQDPGTPPAGTLIGTVDDGHGLLINVYAEQTDTSVNMTVKVMEGLADLRGFYMDVGDSTQGVTVDCDGAYKIGDESVTAVGARDNNMNGTGEKFDLGMQIGTAGMGRDDISEASFSLQGVSLQDLDGLTFGVRATSVGEDRADAVKLVGEFDIPEPPAEPAAEPPVVPPVAANSFPQLANDISSIVLVYGTTSGDVTGDGVYAAKIDAVPWYVEDDLDVWLIDAANYVAGTDPNVQSGAELLGVAITHGDATDYYAMDGDPGIDTAPAANLAPDTTVQYETIIG